MCFYFDLILWKFFIYVLIVFGFDWSSSFFIVFLNFCFLNFRGVLECYSEIVDFCFWKECVLY